MGGKSGPKAPEAPDPVAMSQAQAKANKDTAITQQFLNLINEYTPYGNRIFEGFKDPVTGEQRFRSTINLSPDAQRAFDAEQQVNIGTRELANEQLDRLRKALGQDFSYEGLPAAPVANDETRQRIEDALYNRYSGRINEQFARDQQDLEAKLAGQGVNIASNPEAYKRSLGLLGEQRNDALENAMNQAILMGGQEQSRLFGLEGTARDRAIQEQAYLRNLPLNEIGALLGTGQVGLPQFAAPSQAGVAGTDVIGANALASNIAQQNYLAQLQNQQSFMGGLFGLGGTLGGAYLGGRFGSYF